MKNLKSIEEVSALIASGQPLSLAGSAESLQQLPAGNWIGGTINYFTTAEGCETSADKLLVNTFPADAEVTFQVYEAATVQNLVDESPDRGYAQVITPSGCTTLEQFALFGRDAEDAFLKPVVGWVSGVPLEGIGTAKPAVFLGQDASVWEDAMVAAHVSLPAGQLASLSIVNIFEPETDCVVRFAQTGLTASECLVNGQPQKLVDFLRAHNNAEGRLPLMGDFGGAQVNVSIQSVDQETGLVTFYAPVFADTDYHLAQDVADYAASFAHLTAAPSHGDIAFSCNCILNYLHGELEGRKTGSDVGPITFGEIAFQLINQTLVRLHIHA